MTDSTPSPPPGWTGAAWLPQHVAIIMDGNGRWAERRGRPRLEGHAYGAQSVREIVTACRELVGIKALTLYAFSVQNWGRPDQEVEHLMSLLLDYLVEERRTIMDNGIRLQAIGQTDRLPEKVLGQLRYLEQLSRDNRDMTLTLALSYGGREEITLACQRIAAEVVQGNLRIEDIDEAAIERHLYTHDLPAVDLLIRTSGEMRISNFLLWQVAYAEIVVTEVLWPDFRRPELYQSLEVYKGRQRRFGLTGAQVTPPETGS